MPAAVAAATIAIFETGLVSFGTAIAITSAVTSLGTSLALSFAANKLLAKKPSTAGLGQGRTITVRDPIKPRPVIYGETRVGGTILFMGTSPHPAAGKNGRLHMVIALAGHEVEEIGDIYFDDYRVPLASSGHTNSGRYYRNGDPFVYVEKHLGSPNQTASQTLVNFDIGWTSSHRLRGTAYLYVRLDYSADLFPGGVPNISAIVKGRKVYDPRDPSQDPDDYSTWKYSNNAALCLRDYLHGVRMPDADGNLVPLYGLGCDNSEIDDDLVIAAANICAEPVQTASGGFISRYLSEGVFDSDQPPNVVIPGLLSAMAGKAIWSGGQWRIFAGAYQTPTVTLDESDLRAGFRTVNRVTRRDLYNAVKGTYISQAQKYQPADFPPVTNATYEAQDNGERIWKDITLPFTEASSRAQRIAKIDLERGRQQISIPVLPCKLTAFRVRAGDVILLNNARKGWFEKPFEVASWQLVVEGDDEAPVIGVDLGLREISPTVYDWNSGEETVVDDAPDTELPDPFDVSPPTNLVLDSGDDQLFVAGDGDVVSRIYATWEPAEDAFVERYEIQWKLSSATTWSNGQMLPEGSTDFYISPVEDGVKYDVRVRAVNVVGVRSSWLTVTGHTVIGKTAPPPDVDSFRVARMADGTRRFDWRMDDIPADVRVGGGYRIRYSLDPGAAWEDMTALHSGLLQASPYETNDLAAGTYRFGIKAVDSSGNESTNALYIQATLGDPRLRNVLVQRFEHLLGWPGTKTDCFVDEEGVLRAGSTGWAGLPETWADLASTWADIAQTVDEIVYETPVIDVGADASFTPLVSFIVNGAVTVEMKTGSEADGDVTGSYVPVGPVQGARYIQIRVTVNNAAPSITAMTILLDAETVVQDFEDIDTSTTTASWFERIATGHFRVGSKMTTMAAISTATITAIQSVGAGWTWALVSKSVTVNGRPAAEFKLYDETGALADAVVDVQLKGPRA